MTFHRRDFLKHSLLAGAAVEFGDWTNVFGSPASGNLLIAPELSEQDQVVQLLAGGRRSLDLAKTLLSSGIASVRLKEASCYVIGEHGGWDDAPILLRAFEHPSDQVRHPAIEALQKIIGPYNRNVPLLVRDREDLLPPESLPRDVNRWVSAVCALLKDTSDLVRASAAQTLGLLKSSSCLPHLRELTEKDPMEPVRYFASKSIQILSGEITDFVSVDEVAQSRVPLVTVNKAEGGEQAQQLGPFCRLPWFNPQAKFTIPEWIPARRQTIASLWWNEDSLCLEASCEDVGARDNGRDQLTFLLQTGDQSHIHSFEGQAGGNQVVWVIKNSGHRHVVESAAKVLFSTRRDERGWTASLQIPFSALGRSKAPSNEVWRANLIRVESHGGGPEVSSWSYFHREMLSAPRLGLLHFAERGPLLGFRPEPANLFIFPFDDYSPAVDRDRVVEPVKETIWGTIVPPEHLVQGVNTFSVSVDDTAISQSPLRLVVSAYEGRQAVTSDSLRLDPAKPIVTHSLRVPQSLTARALDVEIEVRRDGGSVLRRNILPSVPIVSPPKRVLPYPLQIVEKRSEEWPVKTIDRERLKIHDHGPMLLTESYPMVLVQGADGVLYGGTYPGGRLFSFDPEAGTVRDLGSPSPPHNHLHDLVATPDGLVFGGLYRPQGRLFVFDTKSKATTDLGVPVSGGSSGTCKVQTWAKGKVYGCQRGHLFLSGPSLNSVINKGNFLFNGRRYQPSVIASDSSGNLLGVAGGYLFRYLPEIDQVLISDLSFKAEGNADELGGWLLRGPDGKLYALANDGRLFRWEPDQDRLVLAARYAEVKPGPGVSAVITEARELIVGRSGIVAENENVLLVYGPGLTQPIDLGNPIPGHLYLTALTLGRNNVVYGVSTRRAYSLQRTPIHVYSLGQA
jgi:hypothetical protein